MNMCGQERKGGTCCLAFLLVLDGWSVVLTAHTNACGPKMRHDKTAVIVLPLSFARCHAHGSFAWSSFTPAPLACHVVAVPHRRTNLIMWPEFLP